MSVSLPSPPLSVLIAALPVSTLSSALPVPLIAPVPVRVRFSSDALVAKLKLTLESTVSVPPASSATVSRAASTT